jgi:Fe(3+) dicitrate transport protein
MKVLNLLAILLISTSVFAQENASKANLDDIYVIGSEEEALEQPGSAHFLNEEELKVFSHTDVNRILDKVPGVYIQEEDGVGLRPNIGIRGAHPHRSKKVTLMEDGVLIAPAPYSAPAAYYFPLTGRLTSMEVFKGPSAVMYGPNSIGGAVNMVTRAIPGKRESEIGVDWGKVRHFSLWSGDRFNKKKGGYLAEVHHLSSDGIKTLSNGDDTGFEKIDTMLKGAYKLGRVNLEVKTGFATETSHETYTGVSADDFKSAPFERYLGTQNDLMDWKHYQAELRAKVRVSSDVKVESVLYHHRLKRNWTKLNGIRNLSSATTLSDVLGSSATYVDQIRLLKGQRDSRNDDDSLILGANDRLYRSQGAQVAVVKNWGFKNLDYNLKLGARYHVDQVARNHSIRDFRMTGGDLVEIDGTYAQTNLKKDTSWATSVFAENEVIANDFTFTAGLRIEDVKTRREDALSSVDLEENSDLIFIPGAGIFWQATDFVSFFGGVNKGVTLVGPGQNDAIEPERTTNYELGTRFGNYKFRGELVGFYSDYKNIKGACSASTGCQEDQLDVEFNGGSADIYGAEAMLGGEMKVGDFKFPLSVSYTKTIAEFNTDSVSDNPEWGIGQIRSGDRLPYIPEDLVVAKLGVKYKNAEFHSTVTRKSEIADQAVQEGKNTLPAYGLVDLAGIYHYSKDGRVRVKLDNVFDNVSAVSIRPQGLRPGKGRSVSVGVTQKF